MFPAIFPQFVRGLVSTWWTSQSSDRFNNGFPSHRMDQLSSMTWMISGSPILENPCESDTVHFFKWFPVPLDGMEFQVLRQALSSAVRSASVQQCGGPQSTGRESAEGGQGSSQYPRKNGWCQIHTGFLKWGYHEIIQVMDA